MNPLSSHPVDFSVIVPTYARPEQLAACLGALARLDYPRDRFEVIVVDDASEMPPEAVVVSFRDRLNVTLVTQSHAGPAAARNTGAARARGEFLAFTDDDCTPAPDWLQALAGRFAATPDRAVGGQMRNALPENPYSTASQFLLAYLYSYYNSDVSGARFFASMNLAMPADRFRAIGGFDTSFPTAAAEDRELCDRWLHHGYQMTYAPQAIIYHTHRLTLRSFWRQHFHYGRGAFAFHRARARRGSDSIRVEPLSFYLDLLRYPFSHDGGRAALLAALLGLSQVANVVGFMWEAARHNLGKIGRS